MVRRLLWADDEPATLEVFDGVHWLIGALASGYSEPTGETKIGRLHTMLHDIQLDRYRVFPPASFIRVEKAITTIVYDFACNSYVQFNYGNMISDIWNDYRVSVDAAIGNLGMDQHLKAIQTGLQTENPESWRAAVFECRNLLDEVANHLWQDERDYYEHLPGTTKGRLDVSEGKSKNRFGAYPHQKGLYGTDAKFVRDKAERLWGSIGTLTEYQSKAHSPIGREQARSIALGTSFILGELTIKTDLQPIEKYGSPQIQPQD